MAAEPEIAARFITSFTQRQALLRLQRHSRAARRCASRSRFAKSNTFVRSSIRAVGIGTCLTTDRLSAFQRNKCNRPRFPVDGKRRDGKSFGNSASAPHEQQTKRRGSGGSVSAAAAKRCRSATFKYFRAPPAVCSVIGRLGRATDAGILILLAVQHYGQ